MNNTLAVMVTGSAGKPSAAVVISKMVWSSFRFGVLRHSPAALGAQSILLTPRGPN